MRKAHEAEVQKEVTKFKTEFLKKIQSNHDIGALHKEHECVLYCSQGFLSDNIISKIFFSELKWKR